MEAPEAVEPVAAAVKTRKKREMTPELLEKLKLARERAAELRNAAKETKSKLPDNIPEKEKSKVAQYLTTRKAIKEKIKQDLIEEIEQAPLKSKPHTEHQVDEEGYMLPSKSTDEPPVLPKPAAPLKPIKVKAPEPDTDSDDEYTTIKVPKKKIIKWRNYAEKPPPEPEKPKKPAYNPYTTQHLIGLAMNGYKF
jgi:hypothetical protein